MTMAILPLHKKRDKVLNEFAKEYKERTLAFLKKYFRLSLEDCEDVFQEALITLYLSAVEGKLDDLKSSLYTYFIGICKNKAFEQVRSNKKHCAISLDDDFWNENGTGEIMAKADKILQIANAEEQDSAERQNIVQTIVQKLPSPCNELLWSFYRDALSMKVIATMFGYSSESAAKVTKHRCMEKFNKSYQTAIIGL